MEKVKPWLPGLLLLVAFCILAFFAYKDYGIAWDEPLQREIGLVSYDYVFHDDPRLNTYIERDHGVAFEMPLVMIEKALQLHDSRDIYLMRHLVTHLFFLVCMFAGYMLAYSLFRNRFLASICFLALVCSPRLYAHSFFNSKDLPFLSMFLFSMAVAYWAFKKDKAYGYLILGLAVGYTTGIRLLSILLAGILFLFLCIDLVRAVKGGIRNRWLYLLSFAGGFYVAVYFSWPYLWQRPLHHFIEAYNSLSHFRWDSFVLFRGTIYSGEDLPWYYEPVWFCISTPVIWLAAGAVGIGLFIISFIKAPKRFLINGRERNILLYFLSFCIPVVMVIMLDSVVYDDWRHLYFIYPSFVLLALYGLDILMKKGWSKTMMGLCLLQLLVISVFMVRSHPHQQVYFNQLVPHKPGYLRQQYELDYWGCSNKQALEFILKHDPRGHITVNDWPTIRNNIMILPKADRQRITAIATDDHPDYQPELFRTYEQPPPVGKNIYDIRVLGSTIMSVYKKEN